jgi:hypothetical protein
MIFFNDGIPKQLEWKGIYFELEDGIIDTILSEKITDGYIKHLIIYQGKEDWKHWKIFISVYPNKRTEIYFFQKNEFVFPLLQKCAVIYCVEGKYRPPLDQKYAIAFPSIDEVYSYNRKEYTSFKELYFLDEI